MYQTDVLICPLASLIPQRKPSIPVENVYPTRIHKGTQKYGLLVRSRPERTAVGAGGVERAHNQ